MKTSQQLPIPTPNNGGGDLQLTNPTTGLPVPAADLRAEFERLSRQTPRDHAAESAFIKSKIEMIRKDPQQTEEDKARTIEMLQSLL